MVIIVTKKKFKNEKKKRKKMRGIQYINRTIFCSFKNNTICKKVYNYSPSLRVDERERERLYRKLKIQVLTLVKSMLQFGIRT